MHPTRSFSFVLLTSLVTLIAWLCLSVMMLIFLLWAPFAWVGLKLAYFGSGRPTAGDSSSASHKHFLLKQTGI
jgi:hypothetical protein